MSEVAGFRRNTFAHSISTPFTPSTQTAIMPKAAKAGRARLHDKATKLAKASKTTQDAPDLVTEVAQATAVASNSDVKGKKRAITTQFHNPSSTSSTSAASSHPYNLSKASRKRINKKANRQARENLTGGSLTSVIDALGDISEPQEVGSINPAAAGFLEDDEGSDEEMSVEGHGKKKRQRGGKKVKEAGAPSADMNKGKIGEGKGRTLKEKQRKEQLLSSRAHVEAVLQNPAFKANPFAAIREHAGNSLIMIDKQVKA